MIGEAEYFDSAVSDTDNIRELLEFVAWCASEGNQAGTIASKLSAVLLPPHQLTNGVAYVVAAYQACIGRGDAIARCRRNPEKSSSPDFRGNNCWKDKDWIYCGVRAAAFFACL